MPQSTTTIQITSKKLKFTFLRPGAASPDLRPTFLTPAWLLAPDLAVWPASVAWGAFALLPELLLYLE